MHTRTMTLYRTVTIDKLTSITARVNVLLYLTGLVLKFFKRFTVNVSPDSWMDSSVAIHLLRDTYATVLDLQTPG
jgi:hypothetical protein